MPAKLYNGFRQLDNGIDRFCYGNEEMMGAQASLTLPDGSTRWLRGSSVSEIAEKAFQIGLNYSSTPATPTFQEYSEKVLTTFKSRSLKNNTLVGYRGYCRNHIYPVFGNMQIGSITPTDIQEYLNGKSDMAHKSLKEHLNYMSQVFEYAIAEGIIKENPAANRIIVNPSNRVKPREAVDPDDFRDIYSNLGELKHGDATVVAFCMFTGMRRGELLGLQRKDIDSEFIHVTKEITYAGRNQPQIDWTGKTANAIRVIPVTDLIRPFIPDCDPETYIFGMKDEPPTNMLQVRAWQRITRTIDMHGSTPHQFRHTFATICNNAGIDLKSTKVILGHSTSYDITIGRYTHAMRSQLLEAGRKINAEFTELINKTGAYAY